MVFPSWQDSQCLSHKLICGLEQLAIKQNEKINIMINARALGIIHLSPSFSVTRYGKPLYYYDHYSSFFKRAVFQGNSHFEEDARRCSVQEELRAFLAGFSDSGLRNLMVNCCF